MSESNFLSASLWRRLAAMLYDSFLLFAVLIVIGATMLPFTKGLGINPNNIVFKFYVFSVIFLFLAWFWTHGGQTLGMRAWKIRLVQANGQNVHWQSALIYYLASLPMWVFLVIAIVVKTGVSPAPAMLAHTPHNVLLGLALAWFVFDHLPNNWRQKLARLKMVQMK